MKNIFVTLFLLVVTMSSFAQDKFQLSTHILDISKGQGAPNVLVQLEKKQNSSWIKVGESFTDQNGRIKDFLKMNTSNTGIYKLTFQVKPYFENQKMNSFYPFIEVVFEIKDNEHYHVPITLSANGYSTYRGN